VEVWGAADVAGGVMKRSPCAPWEWHDERGSYRSRVWTRKCASWTARVGRPKWAGNWHYEVRSTTGAIVQGWVKTQQTAKRLATTVMLRTAAGLSVLETVVGMINGGRPTTRR
jgi:hypothetical protein